MSKDLLLMRRKIRRLLKLMGDQRPICSFCVSSILGVRRGYIRQRIHQLDEQRYLVSQNQKCDVCGIGKGRLTIQKR